MPQLQFKDSAGVAHTHSSFHVIATADRGGFDGALAMFDHTLLTKQIKGSMDAAAAFYVSQLANIDPQLYEAKYGHIVFQDLVPVDTSGNPAATTYEYFSYDGVTMGKFVGANPKDIPNVAVKLSKTVVSLEGGAIGYDYSLDELEQAQMFGYQLDATKAKLADRGFQEHAQSVAFNGDANLGFEGLFNNSNVQVISGAQTWAAATQLQRFAMINKPLTEVYADSAQVHVVNEVILPLSFRPQMLEPMSSERPEITLEKYFLDNNSSQGLGVTIKLTYRAELDTAGAGGIPRMMAYEKTTENLSMQMPRALEFLAPQLEGLSIAVPGRYKFSGVDFKFPTCAAYSDIAAS